MQLAVNFFRQLAADAAHLGQVADARADHAFQAAEAGEQFLAPFGADAADALERRRQAGLAAARAVAGDGEAVRFVADGLDQMQPRIVARKLNTALRISADQLFQPRLALRALGHAEEEDVVHSQFRQEFPCHAHLALAAVDQDQVGHDALPA